MVQFKALKWSRKLWRTLLLRSTFSLPASNVSSELTVISLCLSSETDGRANAIEQLIRQTPSEQWTRATDPSSPASSFQKLLFAKWQTAWLATTRAFRGRMNRGLSQERLVEMGPFAFIPSGEADWSRAGFALAVHFKWAVERQRRLFVLCDKLCPFPPDLASVGGVLHPYRPFPLPFCYSYVKG